MDCPCGFAGRASGTVRAKLWPGLTLWEGSDMVAPSAVTWPATMSALTRLRESCGRCWASNRSSRVPAAAAAAVMSYRRARSEERRVGKECRLRWSPNEYEKTEKHE